MEKFKGKILRVKRIERLRYFPESSIYLVLEDERSLLLRLGEQFTEVTSDK